MKSREQLIDLIKDSDESTTYSAREIAVLIEVPIGTVNGWLSDRRTFPPLEIGVRRSRIYNNLTLKRLAVYMGATTQGLGLNGNDVKLLITQLEVEETWGHYDLGLSELASFLLGKRMQILGE